MHCFTLLYKMSLSGLCSDIRACLGQSREGEELPVLSPLPMAPAETRLNSPIPAQGQACIGVFPMDSWKSEQSLVSQTQAWLLSQAPGQPRWDVQVGLRGGLALVEAES